jgi:hypothetical protein
VDPALDDAGRRRSSALHDFRKAAWPGMLFARPAAVCGAANERHASGIPAEKAPCKITGGLGVRAHAVPFVGHPFYQVGRLAGKSDFLFMDRIII